MDYWAFVAEEDIVSNDIYPDPADPEAAVRATMTHDLLRSLAGGGPWYLMEQTASRVNWRQRNVAKAPGQQRLWSYQALAGGPTRSCSSSGGLRPSAQRSSTAQCCLTLARRRPPGRRSSR